MQSVYRIFPSLCLFLSVVPVILMKCTLGMHFLVLTSEVCTFGNFALGFQDAMPLALQSMMELQEISHNKDEEESSYSESSSNAPNPSEDFVSYLYSQMNANGNSRVRRKAAFHLLLWN